MERIKPEIIMSNVYALLPGLAMQAGIKLDLFTQLYQHPMCAGALARVLNVKKDKLAPLLYALVSAGLLRCTKETFSNTQEADTFLVKGHTRYGCHIDFLMDKIWKVVKETASTITRNEPQKKIDWLRGSNREQSAHSSGQYHGSMQAGIEFGTTVDLSATRHLLDIAGGSGGLAVGVCYLYPHLKITIGDLPEVVPVTQTFVEKTGMSHRIGTMEVDIVKQPLQRRYGTVVMRSLIQVLSPHHAQKALNHIRAAMAPGGLIHIIGYFIDDTRLFPKTSVLHNLLFLNVYEDGRAYTESDYRKWLKSAGFTGINIQYGVFSDGTGLITARRA